MNTALRNTLILVVLAFVAGIVYWQSRQDATPSTEPAQPATTSTDSAPSKAVVDAVIQKSGDIGNCPANPAWFPHSQTQRTDDAAFPSDSNCVFHQWAWQNFLWLTQDVEGQPRFLSFATPESLLGKAPTGMLPRMGKSDSPEAFDEFLQAGTDGIFVAHNGRSVYYSQYLDPTFVNFVQSNNLTDPAVLRALDPYTTFPIEGTTGAMELKVSWQVVTEGFDASTMFTMQTEVAKLVNRDGQIVIDTSQTETVTVALVGFHIAGVVAGHPEMIWATFEHQANAPNVPPGLALDQPVSDQDFTFYSAGTTLADCNVNHTSDGELQLDEATQTLSPITQACRQYQYGNADGVNTINDKNIETLNASVAALFDPDDVWKHYAEVGAIWFKDTSDINSTDPKKEHLQPGLSLATDELLSGSLSLSNATIETFTQVASTENNCFRCHNTMQQFPPKVGLQPLPASNLNISHALQNIYFWSQEDAQ